MRSFGKKKSCRKHTINKMQTVYTGNKILMNISIKGVSINVYLDFLRTSTMLYDFRISRKDNHVYKEITISMRSSTSLPCLRAFSSSPHCWAMFGWWANSWIFLNIHGAGFLRPLSKINKILSIHILTITYFF